jgi:hypothetical protein
MERVGEKKELSDGEKVAHLERWANAIIESASKPLSGNILVDGARMESIAEGLKEALEYDTRKIIIRWYV